MADLAGVLRRVPGKGRGCGGSDRRSVRDGTRPGFDCHSLPSMLKDQIQLHARKRMENSGVSHVHFGRFDESLHGIGKPRFEDPEVEGSL